MSNDSVNENKTGLVPRLRFPEFREAGEWEEKRISRLIERVVIPVDVEPEKNYREIGIRSHGKGIFHKEPVNGKSLGNKRVFWIEENAFIVNIVFAWERAIAVTSRAEKEMIASHRFPMYRGRQKQADVHFLKYFFLTPKGKHLLWVASPGGAGRNKTLGQKEFEKLEMLVPPNVQEQQKIASCLSSLDALIAAQADKLDALKTYKKGLMQQLFPREGETVPRLRFPEFREAGEWEERELGPLTTKVGSGITPRGGEKNYKPEGRPFIRSQNVGWGELILDDIAFIDEETHGSFDSTEVKELDVLLNITGASIGRSAIADSRVVGGNVNQHVCIIRVKQKELNPVLLNQFLISENGQDQVDSFQAGGNRQGLNFGQIRSFKIPLPPIENEQQRIAACLSSLDALIAAQADKLDALKTHKKGLMQQLFPDPEAAQA